MHGRRLRRGHLGKCVHPKAVEERNSVRKQSEGDFHAIVVVRRTLWRPLYRRFENTYVILAVGPEAQVDQSGFDTAVADAQARRKAIEDAL
jgi:hypothetical protein